MNLLLLLDITISGVLKIYLSFVNRYDCWVFYAYYTVSNYLLFSPYTHLIRTF
jgi:hypothetical protein